ncbi:ATP synthase subunit G atp20 [Exophiala dermatitidis]|uniref:F-type H+-transporting ATPase subunit G n=2 Tax=Exophiala dermatitidis TaxID=5970 RepID=H6C1P2_EXODN|nr:F-type H+-transporting ATPase subunit G [Exophiala dermatitidis NIH/UT8656]KAJ4512975.1 ATP synthase subunit G atp20 [Exophiala dermatitidis]EHY57771.1 F-type H+-transporting ATPase subunit G [Exophiala dermatitidis NIH/UT8656]KAJ4516014.1 ATP synthase subunit G atp20 [Exophiala dermatitidis]KAJ4518581.1 ATP synthase subunit G atp20 [Exophiala dermatitidis]KAJ4534088.1 ATP synthase subunit G atp20 [Exophiala dermatitidis]
MSASPASRAILRQSKLLLRRNNFRQASTTSEAASKAQETGKQAVSKASEGLSRVQSSAGSAISKVGSSAYSALSKVGGRTGRVISFVESLIPPTVYYSRVGLELARIVFKGQQMAPPTVAQFQSYFQPLINVFRNPRSISSVASSVSNSVNPEAVLSSIRNVNSRQLANAGIIFAQVLGFFTVGEMIGRWKIVGYHGEVHHEH